MTAKPKPAGASHLQARNVADLLQNTASSQRHVPDGDVSVTSVFLRRPKAVPSVSIAIWAGLQDFARLHGPPGSCYRHSRRLTFAELAERARETLLANHGIFVILKRVSWLT
jgi:hypothetical protein